MNSFIRLIENALWPFRVIWSYSSRLMGYGRKLKGGPVLTLAGKISVAFFLGLALFITLIWILGTYNERSTFRGIFDYPWVDFPLYYLFALLLAIAVYWCIRLATRDKPSLYPEIDRCWEPIESWREKNSLAWDEFHRYLVLGADLETSKSMHADMPDRKIGPLPTGINEWMHWFGTDSSAYLHLKQTCHVADRLERLGSGSASSGSGGGACFDPMNTIQASVGVPEWSASLGVDAATEEIGYGDSMEGFGGSLDVAESLDPYATDEGIPTDDGSMPTDDTDADSEDGDEEYADDDDTPMDRIRYVCQLMRSKTNGEMPINGVVIVIPFDKFMSRENFKAISASIKKDLLAIRQQLEVSFPVSFLFTSMEKDQGFPKLQNLLGSKRSSSGRFGAGCKVSEIPVIERPNLETQVENACRSFEDWVTNRWGKQSQLSRGTQNKELYKMVIRVRQKFRPRLLHLLEQSLLWSQSEREETEVDINLAGCYFASTGGSSAERGFVNGVFLKCDEFADTISWGNSILSRDRAQSAFASLISVSAFVLLIGVISWLLFGG